jgi:hypothetical protein
MERKTKYAVCLISIVIVFFYIFYFPSVNDFIYGNMKNSMDIITSSHVNNFNAPGYDVFNAELSLITNIPLERLPYIPLQLIPIVLFFYCILISLNDTNKNITLIFFISLAYLLSSFSPAFIWAPHVAGIILMLMILYLIITRLKNEPNDNNQKSISIAIIISISSLIFVSYKLTFFTIAFMTFLQLYYIFVNKFKNKKLQFKVRSIKEMKPNFNFFTLILISIVITLYFNKFIYKAVIPLIIDTSNTEFSGANVISKLFKQSNPSDILTSFYFKNPYELTTMTTIFLLCVMAILIICTLYLIHKFIRRKKFNLPEIIYIVFIATTFSLNMIYARLGFPDLLYLTMASFIGIIILLQSRDIIKNKKTKTKIISGIIVLMFIPIVVSGIIRVEGDLYSAQRDYNYNEYLSYPSQWLYSHYTKGNSISSDVLSYSYFAFLESAKSPKTPIRKNVISDQNFMNIISGNTTSSSNYVIINKFIKNFYLTGWSNFNGWSNYEDKIDKNNNLNLIYSSGKVKIIKTG